MKGCLNENCVARRDRIKYKKTDDCCSKCGRQLGFVCKSCFKQLPDDTQKYCISCKADMDDKKDNVIHVVKKIVDTGGKVAVVVLATRGKKIYDLVKKKF